LLSFIVTAFLALLLSSIIILHEARRKSEAKILRKLLLSFSDQQVLTGIGIQRYAVLCLKMKDNDSATWKWENLKEAGQAHEDGK
jgi:hypothetical protein